MIRPGDMLENPVTGEVLVFHRTSEQTNGESVLVETIVQPHGFVAAAHVHPHQSERFEIVEGVLGLRVGDEELAAPPGNVAVVAPGTPTASGTPARRRRGSSAKYVPRFSSSR
jgi:quercetin dioxygenase-like cupin family protein